MSLANLIFYFFAILTIGSAIYLLITKNVLHAAFSLLVTFIGVAAIFVFAAADFMAVVQVMIYVGGVLILLLFGIMLTNRLAGDKFIVAGKSNSFMGVSIAVIVFAGLIAGIINTNFKSLKWIAASENNNNFIKGSTVSKIGAKLMTDFILPFEISALILMVALMGAALIASKFSNSNPKNPT